jgi:hypothetical protein
MKETWTVEKILKTCVTQGTALYMVWTTEDQKQHAKTSFVGNVRTATVHSTAIGMTTCMFKDGTIRTIRGCDIAKVIEVSNNILNSRAQVHQAAKVAAQNESLCGQLVFGEESDDEDGSDEEQGEDSDEEKGEDSDEASDGEPSKGDKTGDAETVTKPARELSVPPQDHVANPVEAGKTTEGEGTRDADTITKVVANGAVEQPQLEPPSSVILVGGEHGATASINPTSPETEQPVSGIGACTAHERTTGSNTSHPNNTALSNPPPPPTRPNDEKQRRDGQQDERFPLSNPPPIFSATNREDSKLLLPTTLRELRAMESLVKEKKKAIRSLKKLAADPNDKLLAAKQLAAQLKAMKEEVKMEKEQAKKSQPVRPSTKRPRHHTGSDDEDGDDADLLGEFTRPGKRVLNTIDKWQKGHRKAALSAAQNKLAETVTVSTWAEAHASMCEHGWAIVDNFVDLLHPACRPDADMRDYILDCTLA